MASQYLARLGIVLGVDSGELVQGITEAKKQFHGFANQVEKDTKAAAREFEALKVATEDYGRTLTKVEQIQREIERGRFMFASQNVKDKLLEQAKAYDAQAAAMKRATGVLTEQQKMQVGFQLTDFVTQIASGQNAMIAFIQQGGQLKDTMGGVGNAIRALTSFITPFRVAIAGVATIFGSLAYSFIKAENDAAKLRDALILTGNFAGTTQAQVVSLSTALAEKLSVSYSKANDVLLQLVSSGKFSSQTFDVMSRAILRFSSLSGVDAKEAATKLMGAFDGTAASVKNLNSQYHFLTLTQYRQIEALERQGRAQEAIQIGAKAFLDSVEEQERKLGTLEKIWKKLGDAVEYAKNALLSIGRDTDQDKLADLAKKIEITSSNLGGTDSESIANRSKNKQLLEQYTKEYVDLAKKMQDDIMAAEKKAQEKRDEQRKIDLYGRSGGLQGQIQVAREAQKAELEAYFKNAQAIATEQERIDIDLQKKITEAVLDEYQKNQDTFGFQAADLARKRVALVADAEAEAERKRFDLRRRMAWEAASREFDQETEVVFRLLRERDKMIRDARMKGADQEFARQEIQSKFSLIGATQKELEITQARIEAQRELQRLMDTQEFKNLDKDSQNQVKRMYESTLQAKEANIELADSLRRVQNLYDAVWSNMSSAIEQFVRTGKFSIKDFTRSVIQDMLIMQMKLQAMTLVRGLLGSLIGNISTAMTYGTNIGSQQTSMLAAQEAGMFQQRAAGGPISAGSTYLVGEKGPELFMPSGSGTIIPNNELGGGSVTNVTNNYINAIDVKSFEQRLLESNQTIWSANQYAAKNLSTNFGRT